MNDREGRAKVLATRPFDQSAMDHLASLDHLDVTVLEDGVAEDRQQLVATAIESRGILCMISERIGASLMQECPHLEIISNMAVGYDNIDVAAATERGIVVCNTPDVLTDTTAELAIALMFAAARRIVEADRFVRAGRWREWAPNALLGRDLFGGVLGIVGPGRIGTAVAKRARALGMELTYCGRSRNVELEQKLGAQRRDLGSLLEESDVVSLHAPLTSETKAMIGPEELRRMKPTAILINTARGGLVRESALAKALQEKRLFAAGLDVFENEPEVSESLLTLENVVLAPHIGSASVGTRRKMAMMAVENLNRYFAGREVLARVN